MSGHKPKRYEGNMRKKKVMNSEKEPCKLVQKERKNNQVSHVMVGAEAVNDSSISACESRRDAAVPEEEKRSKKEKKS